MQQEPHHRGGASIIAAFRAGNAPRHPEAAHGGGALLRIGIDTGGTFTDVVAADGDRLVSFKVPSTPADPSSAILEGLARLAGAAPGAAAIPPLDELVHGSTVATNALLEGKTARTALLTTEGFEDVLEIGRQARPSLYDIEVRRPAPLVPRDLRFGIRERVLASGDVRHPLDRDAVRTAAERAARDGAASIAVCFLHSYMRPEHEEEAGRILAGVFRGSVTLSSSLLREFREYERCSTTAVNAAVAPVVGSYLKVLAAALQDGSLRIMGSDGGALSAERAAAEAVRTVLSGPAAGVMAAGRACAAAGVKRSISFDMGGTSSDVSLLPGRVLFTGEAEVAGYPIRTQVVDIHTVGAGGGSIAWVDAAGGLKVGPQSAGADPGPAAYGRGGPATVTDADLVLGRIVPDRFLDGRMRLDVEAAARAVGALAARLALPLETTARGILEIANVTMARALREVSLFRGCDPADYTLCAFGGAGPLHGADLAEATGIRDVLVPSSPGVLSAWGLLAADVLVSRSLTILRAASSLPEEALDDLFRPLEASALRTLDRERRGGSGEARLERSIEARYRGQSHEIPVPADARWVEAFHAVHRERYGFDRRSEEVVAVTLRLSARLPSRAPALSPPWAAPAADPVRRPHKVWDRGAWREGVAVERATLRQGDSVAGPAVITEAGATTYLPLDCVAVVAPDGALLLGRHA